VRSLGPVPGSLTFDARLSHLFSFHDTGVVIGEESGTVGFPKWSGSLTAGYHFKQVSVSWMARFLSAMKDQAVLRGSIPANNPLNYSGPGSYVLNDLTLSWQGDKANVTLGVNNVFDKDPLFAYGSLGGRNTYGSIYDVLGRYFYLNAGYKF
jgi:outer membrane receptor protein involved in Fe transport